MQEPLLEKNENRFTIFPIKHYDIWEFYKKAQASFWIAEEIDLIHDIKHFENLTNNEKHFISYILAFFAASDGIVNENLALNFYNDIEIAEVRCFYGFQIMIENIHSEVYSLLIDTYIKENIQKEKLLKSIEYIPCISKKANWALQWCHSKNSIFQEKLIAFVCVEGIFFSGSFCAIFWLKKRGLLPGLCFANELISRDEGLHCDFACLLYSKVVNRLSKEKIYEIFDQAVSIEKEFITNALPVHLIGMNNEQMIKYIEFVADKLLESLNYPKKYHSKNPFEWMDMINLHGKTNFFEKRVGEYSKSKICLPSEENKNNNIFTLHDEF